MLQIAEKIYHIDGCDLAHINCDYCYDYLIYVIGYVFQICKADDLDYVCVHHSSAIIIDHSYCNNQIYEVNSVTVNLKVENQQEDLDNSQLFIKVVDVSLADSVQVSDDNYVDCNHISYFVVS